MSLFDPAAAYAALQVERNPEEANSICFDCSFDRTKLVIVARQWTAAEARDIIRQRRQLAREGKSPQEIDACLLGQGRLPCVRHNGTIRILRTTKDSVALTIHLNRALAALGVTVKKEDA